MNVPLRWSRSYQDLICLFIVSLEAELPKMTETVIDLLIAGAEANNADEYRQENIIELPSQGTLIVAGDTPSRSNKIFGSAIEKSQSLKVIKL